MQNIVAQLVHRAAMLDRAWLARRAEPPPEGSEGEEGEEEATPADSELSPLESLLSNDERDALANLLPELADEGGSGPLREAMRRLRFRHLTVPQTNMGPHKCAHAPPPCY